MKRSYEDIDSKFFRVIDVDSGKNIPHVRWADDETGEYDQTRFDENGKIVLIKELNEIIIAEDRKKGNIKFVDIRILGGAG